MNRREEYTNPKISRAKSHDLIHKGWYNILSKNYISLIASSDYEIKVDISCCIARSNSFLKDS